jgi:hypothetical protein
MPTSPEPVMQGASATDLADTINHMGSKGRRRRTKVSGAKARSKKSRQRAGVAKNHSRHSFTGWVIGGLKEWCANHKKALFVTAFVTVGFLLASDRLGLNLERSGRCKDPRRCT